MALTDYIRYCYDYFFSHSALYQSVLCKYHCLVSKTILECSDWDLLQMIALGTFTQEVCHANKLIKCRVVGFLLYPNRVHLLRSIVGITMKVYRLKAYICSFLLWYVMMGSRDVFFFSEISPALEITNWYGAWNIPHIVGYYMTM